MLIKLNKNTIYVNFNKHKLNYVICDIKNLPINREYIVIPIIPMVGLLKTKQKTNLYITLLPEILMQKILNRMECEKRIKQYTTLQTNNY